MLEQGHVWRGETPQLPVSRKILGSRTWQDMSDTALSPPDIDPTTPAGRLTRSKLLRACAREEYSLLPNILCDLDKIDLALTHLGLTKARYFPDLVTFVYFAQARCDPALTIESFTCFYTYCRMVATMTEEPSQALQTFIFNEREHGRFTLNDFWEALGDLGFGPYGTLSVNYGYDVPDEVVENAWREAICRAWCKGDDGQQLSNANDAFRHIAEMRRSEALWKKWQQAKDDARADGMLITFFAMWVEDQPNQVDRMREAVSVVAGMRDSHRLRRFLETGCNRV
ncbi:hypothetical protein BGW80DRAFT_1334705 [Lactifluus volemus]|nr:hypothetical protein BGW80DRAFT_1334705 [Lactifluus volemus]